MPRFAGGDENAVVNTDVRCRSYSPEEQTPVTQAVGVNRYQLAGATPPAFPQFCSIPRSGLCLPSARNASARGTRLEDCVSRLSRRRVFDAAAE